jgi:Tol biopolymer transport system component
MNRLEGTEMSKRKRFSLFATLAVVLCVCLAWARRPDFGTTSVDVPPAEAASTGVTRIVAWRAHEGTVDWSPDGKTIAYGAKNAEGYYEVHLADPDGSHDINLTAATPGLPHKHVAQPAWHPSGRYLLLTVEKPVHARGSFTALPGFAGYTDVWLITSDGKRAWPLTDVPNGYDHGIMTPRFSPDGRRLLWTERVERPRFLSQMFGLTVIRVADFVEGPGAPKLANIRTFAPGGRAFYECYGFSPDGSRIIFQSDFRGRSIWDEDIFTMDSHTGGDIRQLTSGDYNEHAFYKHSGKAIVWMTNTGNHGRGTDWWMMDPDGRNKRRLTSFNNPKSAEWAGRAVWACFGSFSPDDTRFVGDVQTSLLLQIGVIKMVYLAPSGHTNAGRASAGHASR